MLPTGGKYRKASRQPTELVIATIVGAVS